MTVLRGALTRRLAISVAVLTATLAGVSTAPVALAAPACKVKNTTTGVTKSTLQAAVTAATGGHVLEVRGLCLGLSTITKNLTIVGKPSTTLGVPILDADGAAHVLVIQSGRTVTIASLTVMGGDGRFAAHPDNEGGGIRNEGTLTLRSVVVTNNLAEAGGGISTTGRLTLAGTTRLTHNDAMLGGGLRIDGTAAVVTVILKDAARIDTNTATTYGGGVHAHRARVTLDGTSHIDHNEAGTYAGGISLYQGSLTPPERSRIHHNKALAGSGGGVNQTGGKVTMGGKSRIHGNTASAYGGAISKAGGLVTLKGEAQVDHNTGTGIDGAGAIELWPGDLVMNGSSSIHDNKGAYVGGVEVAASGPIENSVVMNDSSSFYGNIATIAGNVAALSVDGDLTMNDSSVVRDHASPNTPRVVEIFSFTSSFTPKVTMTGASRIKNNISSTGPEVGALVLYSACDVPATASGIASRVIHNTPTNIATATIC